CAFAPRGPRCHTAFTVPPHLRALRRVRAPFHPTERMAKTTRKAPAGKRASRSPKMAEANGRASNGAARRFTGDALVIKGARQHNIKNADLTIPKEKLVVVTGPSGSGKSSLVFDTIYAEGQRRYVESLSAYARQFLERMDKPDVDLITG